MSASRQRWSSPLLDSIQQAVEQHCEERTKSLGIPIRVMGRDDVVPSFLKHLGDVAATEGEPAE